MSTDPLLKIKGVTKIFKIGGIFLGSKLTAVDDVNLVMEGNKPEILTLAGESGSGKTTLARMILGLIRPTKGQILYKGRNIFNLNKKEIKKEIQPIFQNPYESFSPLHKVDTYLKATALNFGIAKSDAEAHKIIYEALDNVGLKAKEVLGHYPHEFSGGQLQRVSVARAIMIKPRLLIADEPVSMVDASTKMNILNLFLGLKRKFDINIIYITHDLATAYYASDHIAIMYRGSIVEYGNIEEVLESPLHPYTRILRQSLPEPDPEKRWQNEIKISGLEVKEFEALGCKFANRCPEAKNICFKKRPTDITLEERRVKCWLYAGK